MKAMLLTLAERGYDRKLREVAPVLLLLFGILVAAVIAGCIVVFVIRRRSLRDDTTATDIPLSLSEVRDMHARGEIDDDEMQRLKDIITTQARRETPGSPPKEGA